MNLDLSILIKQHDKIIDLSYTLVNFLNRVDGGEFRLVGSLDWGTSVLYLMVFLPNPNPLKLIIRSRAHAHTTTEWLEPSRYI